MRRMNAGVRVRNNKIDMLLYADELQSLLDVVNGYGKDFGVRVRREESKVMMVNRSEDESNAVWRVGENELNQVLEY